MWQHPSNNNDHIEINRMRHQGEKKWMETNSQPSKVTVVDLGFEFCVSSTSSWTMRTKGELKD